MSSWSMPIMLAPRGLSTPMTRKRHVLHADFLADRRLVVEQLALDGLADQADRACRCGRRRR